MKPEKLTSISKMSSDCLAPLIHMYLMEGGKGLGTVSCAFDATEDQFSHREHSRMQ